MTTGFGLTSAALVQGIASAQSKSTDSVPPTEPFDSRASGAVSTTSGIGELTIKRRTIGPHDVLLDVLYCGVCHSDIHTARGEWGAVQSPCVPGHEVIGRVAAIGEKVTKFKVGDIGGVGCMVDACLECDHCRDDREQNCLQGATFTYDSVDKVGGGHTYGGYSEKMVDREHFVIRIPPGADRRSTGEIGSTS
jgi:uncharacterized zinc-type alcohol dehydrogenase-like protein